MKSYANVLFGRKQPLFCACLSGAVFVIVRGIYTHPMRPAYSECARARIESFLPAFSLLDQWNVCVALGKSARFVRINLVQVDKIHTWRDWTNAKHTYLPIRTNAAAVLSCNCWCCLLPSGTAAAVLFLVHPTEYEKNCYLFPLSQSVVLFPFSLANVFGSSHSL